MSAAHPQTTPSQSHPQSQSQSHPQPLSQPSPYVWALGQWLHITTVDNQTRQGQLYAYDPITSSIVIQTPHKLTSTALSPNKYDFHIIKTSFIQTVTLPNGVIEDTSNSNSNSNTTTTTSKKQYVLDDIYKSYENTTATLAPLGIVSIDKIRAKESTSIKKEKDKQKRITSGIPDEGHDIFDALNKTLPCKWKGVNIVVLEEILVEPPYQVVNVRLVKETHGDLEEEDRLLARVKMVLAGERRKRGWEE